MQARDNQSITIPASGSGSIVLSPNGTLTYVVGQVSLKNNPAPLGATCWLRINGSDITPIINSGSTAAGEPPTWVYPGDRLTVDFAGYTPGQTLSVMFLYEKRK